MVRMPASVALGAVVLVFAACGGSDSSSPMGPSSSSGPAPSPRRTVTFAATSQGYSANPSTCGGATFTRDGATMYSGRGCMINGARGFNVAAIDPASGELREPVQNFDTWLGGAVAARALIDFLGRQPSGTVLLIAVGDEAGLTVGATAGCARIPAPGSACCRPLGGEFDRLRLSIEALGAQRIGQYCYWGSYSLIAIKGVGLQAEQLVQGGDAITRYTLTIE